MERKRTQPKKSTTGAKSAPRKYSTRGTSESPRKKYSTRDSDGENRKTYEKKLVKKSQSSESYQRKTVKKKDDSVRLNKFIANSGICSRREADEFITAGVVSVNGVVVTELGTKVKLTDEVRFNDERLKGESKAYVLLNKPKDYITTMDDPHAKKTVMELIEGACKERVYPVGRLDRNTTGVLLFTNDGDLAKKLTHPSYNKMKVYQVRLDKNITKADITKLLEGITLEDGLISADNIQVSETNKNEIGVEIHSGRNRIIRRMFEHLGYKVAKLDRVYFAGLTKKGLRRGQYRVLTPKEIEMLKMGAYE